MTAALLLPPRRFTAVSSRALRSQREVEAMVRTYRKQERLASVVSDFNFRPGFLYNTVRAISARVNQNYDAWPSSELKKSYRSFLGKPCFVNHHNEDPTKARGRVIASRYIEKGADRYIEVIQEIDALRFPLLAHEIRTGGLDSVSMGVEAGFTICSICENRATDIFDMCNHVKFHKGETMRNKKTGARTLVYEKCYKLGFFELSYVFDPADETAVVSRVIAANRHQGSDEFDTQWEGAGTHSVHNTPDGHKLMVFPPTSPVSPLPGENPRPAQWEWAHLQGKPIDGTHFLDHEVVNHGVSPREDVARAQAMESYKASKAADRLDADSWDPDRDPHDPRYDARTGSRQWLAYGEVKVPQDVDTLRDEDETETSDGMKDPFHHWITSPAELQDPDTSSSHRLDKTQEDQGLDKDRRVEDVEEFGAPSPMPAEDPRRRSREHEDDDRPAMPINPPAPRKGERMTRGVPMSRSYHYSADEDEYTDDGGGDYQDDGGEQGYDTGGEEGYDDGGEQGYEDGGEEGGEPESQDPDELVSEAEQDLADYDAAQGDDGSYESDEEGYDDGGDSEAPPWADDGGGDEQGEDPGAPEDDGGGDGLPPWEDNREARRRRGRPVKKRGTRGKKRGRKGGAPMPRGGGLADRARVAAVNRSGPMRHFADDSGHTDGGPYGVDDSQGAQEDVFISQVPSAEAVDMPTDDTGNISNTPDSLVASRRQGVIGGEFDPSHYQKLADSVAALPVEARAQMALHMAKTLQADNPRFNWRTFFAAAKVPFTREAARRIAEELVDPDKVDPGLSGTDVQDLKGDEFESLALDNVETQPKDASVHAFRQFDNWLRQVTGRNCREHGNANYIRRAAVSYANRFNNREGALGSLFPTLEYVLREARKIEASQQDRRANMRRQAEDTSLSTAAPDGRVDVEAPVKNVTDADAQASQFDLGDFANNAGDDIADPVLDVVDGNAGTWAPDEGSSSKESSVRLATSTEAMRCAMAYQRAMPRKYGGEENFFRLTARFETVRGDVVRQSTRLLEEVAGENRTATRRKQVTAGRSRGTNGIPMGLGSVPTRTAANNSSSGADFINDPNTDYALYT